MANRGLTSKAKIVILFANQYDMKDESGNKLTGCSVHYLSGVKMGKLWLLNQSLTLPNR